MTHSKQRYLFIDLLRFIAVFFMVQGHTFDALVNASFKTHSLFYIYDMFHGFVAPMFLFASGVAFGVSTLKKWEQHIVPGFTLYRRIGKFFSILLIGYALHLPYFSLHKIIAEASTAELLSLFQVDALQCIAVTLLFLEALVFFVKREYLFVKIVGALVLIFIFLSPIVWSIRWMEIFPFPLALYFNGDGGSWFPLFPSSAYVFSGVVFASVFIEAKEHRHAMAVMQKAVIGGVLLIAVGAGFGMLPLHLYPIHDFWKASPLVFMSRLGFIIIVTSSIYFFEHSVSIRWKLPQILGSESLFIYIVHLMIVYGSVLNVGLTYFFNSALTVVSATAAFFLIMLFISVLTYFWHYLKVHKRSAAYGIQFTIASLLFYFFLARPW